jgi:quercetin dioxygenase-like cupin family protein
MNGATLTVKMEEVTYPPGAASPVHSHGCPVIGYVVKGAVRMKIKGQEERTYRTGETFYEAPNSVHLVSANASKSEPATFVAYFICDHDTALTVPAPADSAGAHR